MTPAEERFMVIARRKGFYVLRPSWPDFLCLRRKGDDDAIAVEVKQGKDRVSENQFRTFDFLDMHTQLDVYLWHRSTPQMFWPWDQAREIENERSNRSRRATADDGASSESGS